MGKTWSRSERKFRNASRNGNAKDFARRVEQPETITYGWVAKRLARHVDCALDRLVGEEVIASEDKEFYARIVGDSIRAGIETYDPKREDEEGRTTSAVHFFEVIADRRIMMIRRYLERYCRSAEGVPISQLEPGLAEKFGYVSEGALSDGMRSVRELEFRMDTQSLVGMLTVPEAVAFRILMEGGSQEDAERAVCIPGGTFRRVVLAPLRAKCRICGFVPRREVRPGHA